MDTKEIEIVYPQLYVYTYSLLESYPWFRKGKTDSYLKGQQVEDYVMEAIEQYLTHPEKYDKSKGRSLVNYIKLHIIRNLVRNDAKSPENQTSSELFVSSSNGEDDDDLVELNPLLPFRETNFDEEIDYQTIMSDIQEAIQKDEVVQKIFNGVRRDNLKRGDVIKKYGIPARDFDNGMKRLETILKRIALKYNITQTQ